MNITQSFKAHPIGQGFFYSGLLKSQEAEFNFIFDCGSLSYSHFHNAIDRFRSKDSNDTKDLDLLIISHFDKDHINGLKRLLNGRKVKRVVAPFINYKQRVSVALNYISELNGDDDPDPNFDDNIEGILDFSNFLKDNWRDDTEFLFVEESDEPPEEQDEQNLDVEKLNRDIDSFLFNFEGSYDMSESDRENLRLSETNNLKKIDCSKVASITGGYVKIMDLIFYRRKVGANDKKYFDKVFDLFCDEYLDSFQNQENPSLDEIVSVFKTLNGAGELKSLFKKAAEHIDIDLSMNSIENLNTTSLCMLHFDRLRNAVYNMNDFNTKKFINRLNLGIRKVFDGIETKSHQYVLRSFRNRNNLILSSPNTLLTADNFLKDKVDVDAFINHYGKYLHDILIFQVPHHGSKNSSDRYLFSQLKPHYCFINYGVDHIFIKKWSHPNRDVIIDLIATANNHFLLAVNEFEGYKLDFLFYFKR